MDALSGRMAAGGLWCWISNIIHMGTKESQLWQAEEEISVQYVLYSTRVQCYLYVQAGLAAPYFYNVKKISNKSRRKWLKNGKTPRYALCANIFTCQIPSAHIRYAGVQSMDWT